MLPSSTTSQFEPAALQIARASRSSGSRYRRSVALIDAADITARSSVVITVSGGIKPPDAVITNAPGIPFRASANRCA